MYNTYFFQLINWKNLLLNLYYVFKLLLRANLYFIRDGCILGHNIIFTMSRAWCIQMNKKRGERKIYNE